MGVSPNWYFLAIVWGILAIEVIVGLIVSHFREVKSNGA